MGRKEERARPEGAAPGSEFREDSSLDEGERETFIREIGPEPSAPLLQLETYRQLPVHHDLPDLDLDPLEPEPAAGHLAALELQPVQLELESSGDAQPLSERVNEYLREAAAEAREHLSQPPPSS